jgi:membrane dipeptidase
MGFHEDCLVVDGHTDVPTRLFEHPADLRQRLPDRHIDLPRLRQGGVDGLVFALYVPVSLEPEPGWEHAQKLYELSAAQLGEDGLRQVVSAAELRRAAAQGAVGVLFGLENGRPLLVPEALDGCARLGVRYVTLTHMKTHEWCDSATDAPRHGGLAEPGIELVRGMARRGIVPDVSHVSDDAVRQVLAVSPVPVVASHSSARALCDHPRNLPDELVREIARRRGVVMANTYPPFVCAAAHRANQERLEHLMPVLETLEEVYWRDPATSARDAMKLFAAHPLPPATLEQFVDHVVHLVELGGEEHTGIGTDFDGITEVLEGFEDVSRFPALTEALLARGLDRAGVRLILGENFLRVLGAAERYAG